MANSIKIRYLSPKKKKAAHAAFSFWRRQVCRANLSARRGMLRRVTFRVREKSPKAHLGKPLSIAVFLRTFPHRPRASALGTHGGQGEGFFFASPRDPLGASKGGRNPLWSVLEGVSRGETSIERGSPSDAFFAPFCAVKKGPCGAKQQSAFRMPHTVV